MESERPAVTLSLEEFECSVCKRLLHEPLAVSCGHTFCRLCLRSALQVASACPLCRSPCYLNTATAVPSVLLQHVLRTSFPGEAARRAEEAALDAVETAHARLGLFLLPHCPLLPGVPFAVLAFEPRYVLLVDRCWENGLMFGVQAGAGTRRGVTVRILGMQERGACRVVRGVTVNRYKLLGSEPPAPSDSEFGLHSAPVAFVADEPPDADAGVPEGEVVAACLAEAAAVLGGSGGSRGEEAELAELAGRAPPPPTPAQQAQAARLLAHLQPLLLGEQQQEQGQGQAAPPHTVASAAAALRECLCRAAHRLLLQLPEHEAEAVRGGQGPPPLAAASAEAASYWLAGALALTPRQRACAAGMVSTLTRLALCYGVLLTAADTQRARRGGGGQAADSSSSSEQGEEQAGVVGGAAAAGPTGREALGQGFEAIQPRDALSCFSRTGGQGGDDPDADLLEAYPVGSGAGNAVRRVAARGLRGLVRLLASRGIKELLVLVAVLVAIAMGKGKPGQWH